MTNCYALYARLLRLVSYDDTPDDLKSYPNLSRIVLIIASDRNLVWC